MSYFWSVSGYDTFSSVYLGFEVFTTVSSVAEWLLTYQLSCDTSGECVSLPQAANYLDIKALLDILCQTVAGVIKGKDPDVIRRTFNASHPNAEPSQEAHSQSPTHPHSEQTSTHKETAV